MAPLPVVVQGDNSALPSSQVTPMDACPGLRLRWCPANSPKRCQDCCLPPACRASAFSHTSGIILMTTTIHFSELNTQPASLIHPASDSPRRVCPRISLLVWWLTINQVGLESPMILTHWVTLSNFVLFGRIPNDLGLSRHEQAPC